MLVMCLFGAALVMRLQVWQVQAEEVHILRECWVKKQRQQPALASHAVLCILGQASLHGTCKLARTLLLLHVLGHHPAWFC